MKLFFFHCFQQFSFFISFPLVLKIPSPSILSLFYIPSIHLFSLLYFTCLLFVFISILPFFSFTSFKPCNFLSLFPYRPSLFNLPFFFLPSFSFSLAFYFFYFYFIFFLSAFHTLCSPFILSTSCTPFILSTQLVLLSSFPHSLFSFHPFQTACSTAHAYFTFY